MKRAFLWAALAVACLALSACGTTSDPAAVLKALGDNYAHCERTVNYTASVGALNPASGATVSGSVHCPAKDPAAATPAARSQTAPSTPDSSPPAT